MTVRVADARYHSSYNGTEYYFCCLGCKKQFEQAPERYSLTVA
jgi:YHS domain-containing protein